MSKFKIAICWLLWLAIVQASRLYGQVLNFSHTNLPGARSARALFQDRQGYLWVGSEGLVRYDGANFTRYEHEARNPSSLTSDEVISIAQDRDGLLWVGTAQGISCLNPVDGQITNYLPGTTGKYGLNGALNSVFADNAGTVWTGNYAGLSRYDQVSGSFIPYPIYTPTGTSDQHVEKIRADPNRKGWLWLARKHSLVHLNTATGKAQIYPTKSDVFITNVCPDRHGQVWVCSWGQGLGQLDVKTGQYRFFPFEADTHLGTTNVAVDVVDQVDVSGQSTYYLATAGGLTTLNISQYGEWNGTYARPFQVYDPSDSRTPGMGINQLLVDRQNILWLATSQDLSLLAPNNRVFTTITRPGLGELFAVEKSATGGLWMGGWYGQDVLSTRGQSGPELQAVAPTGYLKDAPLPDQRQISALAEDAKSQTLWVGSFGGLFSINLKTGKRDLWPTNESDPNGLPSNHVISLAWLGGRQLWVGTYSRGIALLDAERQKFVPIPGDIQQFLAHRRINVLYTDRKGQTWIGSDWEVIRINPDWSWKIYNFQNGKARCKAEGDVTCMAEDSAGSLWIGSQAGLNRYCPATDDFDLVSTANGLSSNRIQSIMTDRRGTLWVGTENGLSAFRPGGRIQRYYVHNGLYSNNTFNSMTLLANGEVLIGGKDFMTVFNPANLLQNSDPPPTYLSAIKLINQPDRKIYPSRLAAEGLDLQYEENYFSIDFIALNLINPDQNRYAYRMENLDKGWVKAGPERRATYTNLAPGRYRFHVRAANSDGVWNNQGASILVVVHPPFWQTWWFRAICVIAIGLVLYFIYRYRLRQVLALERIRADISAGLHDEIGSTLSSISILSGMTSASAKPEAITSALGTINQSSRGLMEQMNDIVWSINPRHDSLQSLFQRIGQFAAHILEARDIDFELLLPANLPNGRLAVQTRQNLYLILKEAVNNIAKHSQATQVTLQVQLTGHHMIIDLVDNGQGYDPHVADAGNGLHNMANRAGILKADLTITTGVGAGTKLHLRLRWNRYAIDPTSTLA